MRPPGSRHLNEGQFPEELQAGHGVACGPGLHGTSMKGSSRRNCKVVDRPARVTEEPTSMKGSSRRNCKLTRMPPTGRRSSHLDEGQFPEELQAGTRGACRRRGWSHLNEGQFPEELQDLRGDVPGGDAVTSMKGSSRRNCKWVCETRPLTCPNASAREHSRRATRLASARTRAAGRQRCGDAADLRF